MNNITIGLDIAKSTFHLVQMDKGGKVLKRKQLARNKVADYFAKLAPCIVVMEACGSTHYWTRVLIRCRHVVKAIAPQFVTPYRKGNKNDYNDAEAIAEASQRKNMRFVPLKSLEQQDIQMVHRVRERLMKNRTALSNQIRGLLAEYGLVIPKGVHHLKSQLPALIEAADNELSVNARRYFNDLYEELKKLEQEIKVVDKEILSICNQHNICKQLSTMNGIGPINATALYAGIGDGKDFNSGRHLSAWLGLVPRQHSTGGKANLMGISKRGNTYLRTQLINGARAALRHCDNKTDRVSLWAKAMKGRSSFNNATVALANKMARMAWAMLHHQENYKFSNTHK
ncbi:IS110 family transposase [Psychrobium sp. nBUS_13]|uniref:IS110 family transposase n=1 Tax=Psychrobium sp. nBUS_13 TaxID=3395319 RepID=UPI003EC0A048